MALTTLDHVVLAVSDLDAATETYGSLFGLIPSWRGGRPAFGTANTLFRLENTYVELLAAAGEGPIGDYVRARIDEHGDGPLAIALGTDDARATAAELRSRGLACDEPAEAEGRERTTGATRKWSSFMISPVATRGVPLLVIQHLAGSASLPLAAPRELPATAAAAGSVDDGGAAAPAIAGVAGAAVTGATVSGVDHVVVMSSDADAAIALYRDTLGLRLALDRTFDQRGLRLLFFRVGGITIEYAVPQGGGSSPSDRFWGVSYRVGDVAAARERLAREGFDVSEVRTGMKPGTRVCTVRRETHGVATLVIGPDTEASGRGSEHG